MLHRWTGHAVIVAKAIAIVRSPCPVLSCGSHVYYLRIMVAHGLEFYKGDPALGPSAIPEHSVIRQLGIGTPPQILTAINMPHINNYANGVYKVFAHEWIIFLGTVEQPGYEPVILYEGNTRPQPATDRLNPHMDV